MNIITENLRGFKIQFETRPGTFSKVGLDNGSRLLIENMEVSDGTMIADLGCGTGVIGFVAAKLNFTGHVHLIVSNPPLHLGKEFLEEAAFECLTHLKPKGKVYWVVQKHLKPFIEKLFQNTFGNVTIVAHGKQHIVVKGTKNG